MLIGTGIMLVPQILLAVIGYAIFSFTIKELDDAIFRINSEVLTVVDLQKNLLQAPMPANDYLIHGDTYERTNYAGIAEKVNASFSAIKQSGITHTEISKVLSELENAWHKSDILSKEILSADKTDFPAYYQKMEKLDQEAWAIADKLNFVIQHLVTDINKTSELSKKSRIQVQVLIFAVFVIGIMVASLTAYLISRSIIHPINTMREGARKFSEGNLEHRIHLKTDDELAELADTFNNMAETISETHNVLEFQATRDELTGLLNRREFHNQLDREFSSFNRQHQPLCLFLLDIDHFKMVNDTYGHPVGDSVLKEIAYRIFKNIRPHDSAMRYGGEEFVVILPDTEPADAMIVAERLRTSISDQPVEINDLKLPITTSIGISCLNRAEITQKALIKAADDALYQSKTDGRNRITMGEIK